MSLLLADRAEDITLANSRMDYIWRVGTQDVYTGMYMAEQVTLAADGTI